MSFVGVDSNRITTVRSVPIKSCRTDRHSTGTIAASSGELVLHSVGCARTTNQASRIESVNISEFKGRNDRFSRVDACKDEGHSDASSIKTVTCSSEHDCFVGSMKKAALVLLPKAGYE
jgi:hypothetical protein